ncbi:hypothetical protein [Kitasatospora mediocidica]|uniref:hypothetical protein n=1 Tax=Kitasatospora mediocidica TaxID=58352 RepID=UPI000569EBCD|nr:hypothetical protein [Kitasatospora mediocidica]
MTDQNEPTPAIWDPTARDGAGGWVRRSPSQARPATPAAPVVGPVAPQPGAGSVGDQGPPLTARPYLQSFLDAPTVQPTPPVQAPTPTPTPPPLPPPYPPLSPQQPPAQPYRYEPVPAAEPTAAKRNPLLVGVGVVLLLAVGGGVALALQNSGGSSKAQANPAPPATASQHPGGTPSGSAPSTPSSAAPSPGSSVSSGASTGAGTGPGVGDSAGPNALGQAQALDSLLTQGEAAKAPIGNAVAMVASCPAKADIDSAAQILDSGAAQRDQLLGQLGKLSFSDLPGGNDAAQSLKTAWQQSEDIDRSYAAWARTVGAQGCGTSRTAPSTPDKQHADDLNPQATQSKQDFVAKWNALASTYGLAARTWDRI